MADSGIENQYQDNEKVARGTRRPKTVSLVGDTSVSVAVHVCLLNGLYNRVLTKVYIVLKKIYCFL